MSSRPASIPDRAAINRARGKVHRITARLHAIYGSPHHLNKSDPLDELVFIILSVMTTSPSFNRVFDRFQLQVGTWQRLLEFSPEAIATMIKDAGLSQQKAVRLRQIAERLEGDFGEVTLSPLRDMSDVAVLACLTALPGVGIKVAKCVMMYSLGRKVLPVDTHVWRVARRVGLIDTSVPYSRSHGPIEQVVAPSDRFSFHVNAVAHGQQVCLALRPRCDQCVIRTMCNYYRENHDSMLTRGGSGSPTAKQREPRKAPVGLPPPYGPRKPDS